MSQIKPVLRTAQIFFQMLAMGLFAIVALVSTSWSVLAATGVTPWPALLPGAETENLLITQGFMVGLAVLSVSLLAFLPGSLRVMRLENSHRQFSVRMEDVARAYYSCLLYTSDAADE